MIEILMRRKIRDPRLRTRTQIILLAAEKQLVAQEIGELVRLSDQAVRKWLKRYLAEDIEGLKDLPRAGTPQKVTPDYVENLRCFGKLHRIPGGILWK